MFEIIESFGLSKWYRPLRDEGEGGDPRVEKLIVYLHERWEKFLEKIFILRKVSWK